MGLLLIPDVGDSLELEVVTSFKRSRESLVTEYPRESKAAATDFMIGGAEVFQVAGVCGGILLRAGWADSLQRLHGRVLICESDFGTFFDLALKASDLTQETSDGDSARVNLTLKQIITSEARVLVIEQPAGSRTGKPKEAGPQEAAPATEQESDAYDSILSQALDYGDSF